jgi:hypothetical protein
MSPVQLLPLSSVQTGPRVPTCRSPLRALRGRRVRNGSNGSYSDLIRSVFIGGNRGNGGAESEIRDRTSEIKSQHWRAIRRGIKPLPQKRPGAEQSPRRAVSTGSRSRAKPREPSRPQVSQRFEDGDATAWSRWIESKRDGAVAAPRGLGPFPSPHALRRRDLWPSHPPPLCRCECFCWRTRRFFAN